MALLGALVGELVESGGLPSLLLELLDDLDEDDLLELELLLELDLLPILGST